MYQRVTFKRKLVGDYRKWEEYKVAVFRICLTGDEARNLAEEMAKEKDVYEIRYNFDNSLQGYYVPGSEENQQRHITEQSKQ